jgi:hypothetical protein
MTQSILCKIQAIIEQLKNGSLKFSKARRIQIPQAQKKNKPIKFRPLSMQNF